ncbi:MAG TPA: 5-formyltetrahydrofolate cyclo-ligase [Solimonas sp.]|nr:5-formyltetrahydrofolate cyclo-ligase [Solimonas sp.]
MKQALRRELRTRRLRLSAPQRRQAAQRAARHALRVLRTIRAQRIAVYLDCGSELATAPLIAMLVARGAQLAIPRVTSPGLMHFEWWTHGAALRRNRHGIAEPVVRGRRARRTELDAIVLPLVGFDRHGARLGSGGGYYDRWLSRPRIAHKPRYLGYAYALQQVERLPRDDWDVPLDAVITERGITWALSGA